RSRLRRAGRDPAGSSTVVGPLSPTSVTTPQLPEKFPPPAAARGHCRGWGGPEGVWARVEAQRGECRASTARSTDRGDIRS
ncbi:MAG: hypothetical protein M0Z42_16705, partial [Actinomycetota bacterium]|nr:hypothetical protein [Actinomycetota bacterium]